MFGKKKQQIIAMIGSVTPSKILVAVRINPTTAVAIPYPAFAT